MAASTRPPSAYSAFSSLHQRRFLVPEQERDPNKPHLAPRALERHPRKRGHEQEGAGHAEQGKVTRPRGEQTEQKANNRHECEVSATLKATQSARMRTGQGSLDPYCPDVQYGSRGFLYEPDGQRLQPEFTLAAAARISLC